MIFFHEQLLKCANNYRNPFIHLNGLMNAQVEFKFLQKLGKMGSPITKAKIVNGF